MPAERLKPAAWQWRRTLSAADASTVDITAVGRDLSGYTGYVTVEIEHMDSALGFREAFWLWRALPLAIAVAVAGSALQVVREKLRGSRSPAR